MEKKTLLAVVLSSAILIIYYGFLYHPRRLPPGPEATSVSTPSPLPSAFPSETLPQGSEESAEEMAPPPPGIQVVINNLTTPLVESKFTSRGGFPLNWWLKDFFEQPDQKGPHIDLLKGEEKSPAMGLLLFPEKPSLYPYYKVKGETPHSLDYREEEEKLQLEQQVQLGERPYTLQVLLKVKNLADKPQVLTPGIHLITPQNKEQVKKGWLHFGKTPNFVMPLYRVGTKVERERKLNKIGAYTQKTGEISWGGLEDRYFLRAIIARNLSPKNTIAYGKKGDRIFADFRYGPDTIPPGSEREYQFTIYLGPKDPTYLNQFAGAELGKSIDYGWFGVVARPILMSMKFFYRFLGNWGLAIILLTVVIKLLLYPLTKKSMASMKAMQKLQPQLKQIREKFKSDRERLNQETMQLFRTHKVNPMGGCLPMLIQMPIYIALYKVLYNATELYHAPFVWFYRDLSAPDPYYILPILLGIAMVAQQKMTPTTGDPSQAKMMMFMPIMFTAFMLFLPVGLVLYIFVNTVMTVVQQYMHQHDLSFIGMMKGKRA